MKQVRLAGTATLTIGAGTSNHIRFHGASGVITNTAAQVKWCGVRFWDGSSVTYAWFPIDLLQRATSATGGGGIFVGGSGMKITDNDGNIPTGAVQIQACSVDINGAYVAAATNSLVDVWYSVS